MSLKGNIDEPRLQAQPPSEILHQGDVKPIGFAVGVVHIEGGVVERAGNLDDACRLSPQPVIVNCRRLRNSGGWLAAFGRCGCQDRRCSARGEGKECEYDPEGRKLLDVM